VTTFATSVANYATVRINTARFAIAPLIGAIFKKEWGTMGHDDYRERLRYA
jgi:hypothetical protein